MSWQHFKSIGQKLHADLAAQHPPGHVRAQINLLQGLLAQEDLRAEPCDTARALPPLPARLPDVTCGEHLAHIIHALLMDEDPRSARKILTVVESRLTRQRLSHAAITAVDALYADLRKEFEPKALTMILTAAHRAAHKSGRAAKYFTRISPINTNL